MHVREALGLPLTDAIPDIPRGTSEPPSISPPKPPSTSSSSASNVKRKASQAGDADPDEVDKPADKQEQDGTISKRSKTNNDSNSTAPSDAAPADSVQDPQALTAQLKMHAQMAASFIPFLSPEALMPPTLPTKADMEEVLLRLRKEALVQEFFGVEGTESAA